MFVDLTPVIFYFLVYGLYYATTIGGLLLLIVLAATIAPVKLSYDWQRCEKREGWRQGIYGCSMTFASLVIVYLLCPARWIPIPGDSYERVMGLGVKVALIFALTLAYVLGWIATRGQRTLST